MTRLSDDVEQQAQRMGRYERDSAVSPQHPKQVAGNDARERFFNALNENYDALIHRVKAANDRGHRLSTALIEDAQQGQREGVQLAQRWAESPFDLPGLYASLVETATKRQDRARELSRAWLEEFAEARKESGELWQRSMSATRSAAEAGADLARGLLSRAGEATQSTVPSPAQDDGRRSTRDRTPSLRASSSGPSAQAEAAS